ncbi:MAG: monofunctional biosynthetic peptidoglycan transglycosylase [Deltaproteobacteria bacterium]|nr:monofunctional biosynthetic peptidoglycan transglycosylase [Deltaproteobacteria bacterium]
MFPPRRRRSWLRAFLWTLALAALSPFAASFILCPSMAILKTHQPAATRFMLYREHQAAGADREFTLRYTPVRLADLPRYLSKMAVAAEDANFYKHHGFDFDAIEKALRANERRGKIVRGGSTITQQLAKNLWLSPKRSWLRKGLEAVLAARLEMSLEKDRIMELYLNVIEFGDGVFGIEAAARHYYGVGAANLSPTQAATLIASIPQPLKYNPKRPSARITRVSERLLRETGLVPKPDGEEPGSEVEEEDEGFI